MDRKTVLKSVCVILLLVSIYFIYTFSNGPSGSVESFSSIIKFDVNSAPDFDDYLIVPPYSEAAFKSGNSGVDYQEFLAGSRKTCNTIVGQSQRPQSSLNPVPFTQF